MVLLVSQQFAARSFLPSKHDYLWRIETGIVRAVTWLDDGTTVVLGIWGAGSIVGKALSNLDPYQLECVSRVNAIPVPIASLPNLPDVLFCYIHQAEALMQIRSHKRVDVMLINLLNWLAERFGQDVEQGKMIDLRLTHLDLAETIGSTRVTVTRTINQLEQHGIIACLPLKRIIVHEEQFWHYEI